MCQFGHNPFLDWFVAVQEIFCPALAALVGPVINISLKAHYFKSFFHSIHIQQAGQAVVSDHLSLNVCLWRLAQMDWLQTVTIEYQR
jgi:hypothetical protein